MMVAVSACPMPQKIAVRRAREPALARDDGGDRNHVVGISGMPHPEEKSKRQDGKQADYVRLGYYRLRNRGAPEM